MKTTTTKTICCFIVELIVDSSNRDKAFNEQEVFITASAQEMQKGKQARFSITDENRQRNEKTRSE